MLKINKIDCIPTFFIDNLPNFEIQINEIIDNCFSNRDVVIKPTISGSGESTYLLSCKGQFNLPNTILKDEIKSRFIDILSKNEDCKIMLQPYIPEIINGEYSCIFIDGELTHTMLRFPNIFHEKIRTRIELNPPLEVLNMAKKIESISAFNGYLYMRVDMVIVNGMPLVMEVELAEPDLLTKYIDNPLKRNEVINKLSKRLVKRI